MKKARSETVAAKLLLTAQVHDAVVITQMEPLQTPVRKQTELVMSESTMGSIPCFSNSSHVSCDALTNPFPYAAIYGNRVR